jgi:hypothetical protein
VAIGLLAPVWWTWAASQLTYRIYLASGSPSRPSQGLLWWSIFAPALALGLLAGIVTTLLSRASPLKGWVIFGGSLLLGAAAAALLAGATPWAYLMSFFSTYGNLAFWVGSLIWPVAAYVRGRAV